MTTADEFFYNDGETELTAKKPPMGIEPPLTKEQFLEIVKAHKMTIKKDDGLYRHLTLSIGGTYYTSFSIVTWPGYLAYTGDMGDFVFRRLDDMFEFFRGGKINPGYWEEKIQAHQKSGYEEYSEEKARGVIADLIKSEREEAEDQNSDKIRQLEMVTTDEGEHKFFDELCDIDQDGYEYNVKEYTYHYLFCCYAIQWAIEQYDAAKKETKWATLTNITYQSS